MAVSKINLLIIKVVMIIVTLVIILAALFWFMPWMFNIKDGSVVTTDPNSISGVPTPKSQSVEMSPEG